MPAKQFVIHEFAKEGDAAGVLKELDKGVPVDGRDAAGGRTALMEAAFSRRADAGLVRLLIERGADVNAVVGGSKPVVPTMAQLDKLRALVEEPGDGPLDSSKLEQLKALVAEHQEMARGLEKEEPSITVLSLAAHGGDLGKVRLLLDAGADIHYVRPHGYDVLIDVMHGRNIATDAQLVPVVQLLIARGANLNRVSSYSESALSVASREGRFDAVRALLEAGADPSPLEWTAFMHAIVFGSVAEVEAQLAGGADLTARDFWSRTPWLLSLQVGDVSKSKLLLAGGADRRDRGRCGKTPLMYPLVRGDAAMLSWLLSEGFDVNDTDDHEGTALMIAAERGATECVRILLDAGADIHRLQHSEPAVTRAANLEIVRLLVARGADLNEVSEEMRAALTRLPHDGKINVSRADYLAQRHPRFGTANPEKMNLPFWKSMVTSGAIAYAAREHFGETGEWEYDGPRWCFKRFGKSITELPDGRIIEIGGEHEDSYDPDFCIYNDVVVHHGDGTFDIYGYPEAIFPPTDFHTATLAGRHIYVIGRLGYAADRRPGETPVYRLDTESLRMEAVAAAGEGPGWIHGHRAVLVEGNQIRVSGGKVWTGGKIEVNAGEYVLDLERMRWRRGAR